MSKLNISDIEKVTLADIKREKAEKAEFNGHKNWSHWNVSLWLDNDECIYNFIQELINGHFSGNGQSLEKCCRILQANLPKSTPDGARYSMIAIKTHLTREFEATAYYRSKQA